MNTFTASKFYREQQKKRLSKFWEFVLPIVEAITFIGVLYMLLIALKVLF